MHFTMYDQRLTSLAGSKSQLPRPPCLRLPEEPPGFDRLACSTERRAAAFCSWIVLYSHLFVCFERLMVYSVLNSQPSEWPGQGCGDITGSQRADSEGKILK
jgi:hypothetical protein